MEVDGYVSLDEVMHRKRRDVISKTLDESYGSFPGQFKSVCDISDKIVDLINRKKFSEKIDDHYVIKFTDVVSGIGDVDFVICFYENNLGDTTVRGVSKVVDGRVTVELTIYCGRITHYNLSSTIAHELMHCFQNKLDSIRGVNDRSLALYGKLCLFYENAPTVLCGLFFYGLYICYPNETAANISSVANHMESYFKNKDKKRITTDSFERALANCDKYTCYRDIYSVLKTQSEKSFNDLELKYITDCLCGEFNYNGEYVRLYNRNTFDPEKFLAKNVPNIVKICERTMFKMRKNIMEFIENK